MAFRTTCIGLFLKPWHVNRSECGTAPVPVPGRTTADGRSRLAIAASDTCR
ncbi:hypothetical protein PGT21_035860 [Puccinia graminis f. sp. tritici]|uniref:Uncharacterized protein n=1 Tax=Puccinia graminis f. sp. tritici TaxID=56615 RepID=A0A5B0MK15_PUCGR|nr:hypothetical protein PGTUg99_036450 [Puccinia graminis f. sp. tritici]KAA1091519.1 hypothetical protein PGT21_035118 [Puccinia graminis f. sp. tritici]KAA1111025.1 hypothetical protein PGT21_035860 [Puccinia graminis f. sp. tritici]